MLLCRSIFCHKTNPKLSRILLSRPTLRMGIHTRIELDGLERRLSSLLVDAAASIERPAGSDPVVLRWAGGWVRDKLLGLASHDIDVAINCMTGSQFAAHLRDYCGLPGVVERHALAEDDVGRIHTVARQPEKSKHLETAIVRVFGRDVDFVNLRRETYSDDSRNPQMQFGTPEEDALRRDATINSLFYNLHTSSVEDLTGGLADLENGVIRTPLDPLQTFKDDPLRILRLIRFSARLMFSIEEKTGKCMTDADVLDALTVKISRERVGQELEKMLRDKHPRQALQLIDQLDLYHAIFTDPGHPNTKKVDISKWQVAYNGLAHVLSQDTPGSIAAILIHTPEDQFIAWNFAAVSPWMRVPGDPKVKKSTKLPPPVSVIAREGFRASNKIIDTMTAAHGNMDEILTLKKAVVDGAHYINERDRFGRAIRDWDTRGGRWRLQVLAALLSEALERLDGWPCSSSNNNSNSGVKEPAESRSCSEFLGEWQRFIDHLGDIDVLDAPSVKPLLDGQALAAALGVKPGEWTRRGLEACVEWQLRNPGETDPAAAVEDIDKRREELRIPEASFARNEQGVEQKMKRVKTG